MRVNYFYIIFLLCLGIQRGNCIRKNVLHCAFFTPLNSPELQQGYGGPEEIISYALDIFNSQQEILPDYYLNISVFDSGCSQTDGNRAYIKMLMNRTNNLMIIGNNLLKIQELVNK